MIHSVGIVHSFVDDLMIAESVNPHIVADLDSWVCDENRELIGFVMDVLGKV